MILRAQKVQKLQQIPVISIVDDDESVREATKSLVRSLGYRTMTFGSAEEFLESTQAKATACLIADVQMPGLNGVELQQRLIADGQSVPTIFISGLADERLEQEVLRGGALGYLRKPFKEDRLINYIDVALRGLSGRNSGSSSN